MGKNCYKSELDYVSFELVLISLYNKGTRVIFGVLSVSDIILQQKIVILKIFKNFQVWGNFFLLSDKNITKV